jgi:putative acetyltransferase
VINGIITWRRAEGNALATDCQAGVRTGDMQIVTATPDHYAAIADLNRAAFGRDAEEALIACLRNDALVLVERVAIEAGEPVGHILFTRLGVEIEGRAVSSAALAPMAVRPDRQRQGIGSRLVQDGLAELRSRSCEAVIVLGHPGFYPRFGFSAALAEKLDAPFSGGAFMALELMPRALDGHAGSVTYPAAFGIGKPAPREAPTINPRSRESPIIT